MNTQEKPKFLYFHNTGAATTEASWTWELSGITDDPEKVSREADEHDVLCVVVPASLAAAAPQMLDALNEVNSYLTAYEKKEQDIGYVFRSRHAVREAIKQAQPNP